MGAVGCAPLEHTTWGKPFLESQKTLPVGLHSQLPLTSIGGREQQVTYTSRLPKGYRPPDKPIFMAQLSTIYRDTPQAVRELPQRSLEPSTDRAARVSRAARAAAAARRALSTGSSSSSSCRPTFSSSTGSRAIDGTAGPSGDVL